MNKKSILVIFLIFLFYYSGCKVNNSINKYNFNSNRYEISFLTRANPEDKEIFENGTIPWISIKDPLEEINRLVKADEIVIGSESVILVIDYPLSGKVEFTLTSSSGFTRRELILIISEKYHQIYKEEESTASIKTIPKDS